MSEKETNFTTVDVGAEVVNLKPSITDAERKQKLIEELTDNIEHIPRNLPKIKPLIAQIPESGKIGQIFTVKLGKRFNKVILKVYQGETIQKVAGNTNIIHDKTEKDKDEISYDFYDPVPLGQKTFNGLLAGKYLVMVEAYGIDEVDQLKQERIVNITE